jgi:hypothetical protein
MTDLLYAVEDHDHQIEVGQLVVRGVEIVSDDCYNTLT